MSISDLGRFCTLLSCVTAALLAGCGGSQPPIGPPGAMPQSPAVAQADRSGSWMRKSVNKSDLLYVSDGSHEVYVYSYPKGTLVGKLGGFEGLDGMCADTRGNIFIPSFDLGEIFEYAHGGTSPIATLTDSAGLAYACWVDPRTGDLAVVNGYSVGGNGNVAIYRHATGMPKIYTDSNFYYYSFCVYDDQGNLFIEGYAEAGAFEFSELPAGRESFKEIALHNYGLEIGLQWEGTYLALGGATETGDTYIYHIKIRGRTGTTVGTTVLNEGLATANFFILGTRVIVARSPSSENTQFFHYPAGGTAIKTITQPDAVGVVASKGRM
jgi:hypothetical protein